ncbi:AMP-binding protein [Actinomadura sp. KC345]|uniref:protein kinase family protein n=1 Tax=Actinomadura sp. KC345 TaxID=2530371 RepID=UPI00104ED215|nr:protein kinase family protein [Actinomadura sp. KC345]TDC43884.1 AMP-binding protein [Actinomadura sp. KC345]
MSTSVIEPGTRLAGRYRLEERITDSGGSCLWKAIDEILARAVAVRTFDPKFPRITEAVTSARAASRLTDPRLTQVFDADDSGESAYVVSEWVAGESLEGMLAKAPLEPGRAATLLYEASEAMAAAHAGGLSHLCLTPRDLVWTTGGTVKALGVATHAVLGDRHSEDPAGEDVRGLGRMLYAAITAHWPGDGSESDLPAAPSADGVVHPPRLVQAGISHAIDAIVCRCLGIGQAEPLASPAELAKALRGVPRTPLPLFAGLGHAQPPAPRPAAPRRPATPSTSATTQPHQPHGHEQPQATSHVPPPRTRGRHADYPPPPSPAPTQAAPARGRGAHGAHGGGPRRPGNRALLGVAAAALTVIVGLGAWAISGTGGDEDPNDGGVTDPGQQTSQPAPSVTKLTAQGASAFQDSDPGHPDTSIGKGVDTVIDGRPDGTWETQRYNDPNFGNYSKGMGVLLDMGKPVKVANVKIHAPVSGGVLQVKVGDSQSAAGLKAIGRQPANGGELTVTANPQATGRYVLVWFTELPASPAKGRLGEVTVHGSAG